MVFQSFDAAYIQRLKEGDAATEHDFASYFGELLFIKLRGSLRYRQLIEDVRQETLLRVLQTLRQKGGVEHPERFGAFVNAVCNNVVKEFCRHEQRHDPSFAAPDDPEDPAIDLDEPLVTWDRRRQIQKIFAEMPAKDSELLRALYLDEASKAEVCKRFRVDGEYLRVLVHRAKARFRKIANGTSRTL